MDKIYLHANDPKKKGTSNVDLPAEQDHETPSQLTKQIDNYKEGGNELSTAPWDVHVFPLLIPLEVHADAIFKEGGNQAQSS